LPCASRQTARCGPASLSSREPVTPARQRDFQERIIAAVHRVNADFRTAMAEHAASVSPVIELHPPVGGPFAADRTRIKQTRLAPDP
jgi:hypothetical protein